MSDNEKTYQRFSVDQRIEHLLLVISFFVLGLTGLPQKYPELGISEFFIRILGGVETVRFIHRFSAFVMMIQSLYHAIIIGYKVFVLRLKPTMLPGVKDLVDAIRMIRFNIGLSKNHPKMPRYNFMEKAEYWALIWGTVVMGITGFMLWNPIATAKVLPGQIIPAAKVAHGLEAVLAVAAILLWHFYNVHLKHFNWSIFTGRMTRHEMEEEHGEELQELEAPAQPEEPELLPAVREKRQLIFFPVVVITTLVFLFFVFFFINYEATAITTLPEAEWNVTPYSPQTPTPIPTATATTVPTAAPESEEAEEEPAAEAGSFTWTGEIGALFEQKCVSCHGAMGGLSVASLDDLLAGGNAGTAIVPGDAAAGSVIEIQEEGGHMGQFTPEELQMVQDWIAEGAPE